MDLTLARPSDGALTHRIVACIRRPWGRAEEPFNLLTGEPHRAAAVVAWLNFADLAESAVGVSGGSGGGVDAEEPAGVEPAPIEDTVADEPATDVADALRAFGVTSPDELPDFARRLLAGVPCSWRPVRGYGRRGLGAVVAIAWPPKMRRGRAINAPHRRRLRRGVRFAYGALVAGVPAVFMAIGRGL